MATFEASFNSGTEVSHALAEVSETLDTSAPPQKFETLRHRTHGAEMSWVRSVLGPKCPYTFSDRRFPPVEHCRIMPRRHRHYMFVGRLERRTLED